MILCESGVSYPHCEFEVKQRQSPPVAVEQVSEMIALFFFVAFCSGNKTFFRLHKQLFLFFGNLMHVWDQMTS